jgi:hypothetical protein
MKPPTPQELRDMAESFDNSSEIHAEDMTNSRLDDDERETEEVCYREDKLISMALIRWAEYLEERAAKRAENKTQAVDNGPRKKDDGYQELFKKLSNPHRS